MTIDAADFIREVELGLRTAREARRPFESRYAPEFSTFQFIQPDEQKLSSIIAFLLNDREVHAQGRLFLDLFHEVFELRHISENARPLKRVVLEARTDRIASSSRRIDVVLEFDSAVVGIENKPWALDQMNQVADYLNDLAKRNQPYCLIYLHGEGSDPNKTSISIDSLADAKERGVLKVAGYTNLIEWVEQGMKECAAPRVREFLDEFRRYLRQHILGEPNMADNDLIVRIASSSPEHVEAALKIARAARDIKLTLLRKLEQQIRACVTRRGWHLDRWDLSDPDSDKRKGVSFLVLFRKDDKYGVCFEFDKTEFNGCFYGLCKTDESYPDHPAACQCLADEIAPTQTDSQDKWYVWWKWFNPNNWSDNESIWMEILSGGLAVKLEDSMQGICSALMKKNIDLSHRP